MLNCRNLTFSAMYSFMYSFFTISKVVPLWTICVYHRGTVIKEKSYRDSQCGCDYMRNHHSVTIGEVLMSHTLQYLRCSQIAEQNISYWFLWSLSSLPSVLPTSPCEHSSSHYDSKTDQPLSCATKVLINNTDAVSSFYLWVTSSDGLHHLTTYGEKRNSRLSCTHLENNVIYM